MCPKRIKWIANLVNKKEEKWTEYLKALAKGDPVTFLMESSKKMTSMTPFIKNSTMWKEVYLKREPSTQSMVRNEILWNNKHITIAGKTVEWKS